MRRQEMERRIAAEVIGCLFTAGFSITGNDGEEDYLPNCTDPVALLSQMFTTDQDRLYVFTKEGKGNGGVWFVYGNDGWDVVSDYTVNLETVLRPALDYAETLEE